MSKKILIQLSIPTFMVSTWASMKYAWNSIKWIVNPPRCEECGARMHARWYHMEYHHEDNHSRLLVENHGQKKICPKCIAEEVASTLPDKSSTLYDYEISDTCDCCQKEDTTAYKFYETAKIRLHYCMQWWNGFHICRQCTFKAVTQGTIRTGMADYMNGKSYDRGAYGLHLHKGKVKLFKWVKW